MTEPRNVTAKLIDMVSDGSIIVHGAQGEHLIIHNGPAQIASLKLSINKYEAYYPVSEVKEP